MPRPARTKVVSKATTTTRVAKPAARKQAAPAVTKPTTKQTRKATAALQNFSDDSDGLITNTRSTRAKRGAPAQKTPNAVNEGDLEMTGALPAEVDAPVSASKVRTPASNASKGARATRGSARLSAAKQSPAVAAANTRSPIEAASHDVPEEGETSGFGDLTFSSLNSESPAHGTRPPSAVKVGATPAHETSILALTNFKRRARQPSLLRMVQQTTDVEDNDESGLSNTDNFDFDDFLPQDESTPLNKQRTTTEKEGPNDSGAHLSSSGSRGRKRKLTPIVQVPRSSPPFDPPSGADVESVRSPSLSLPEVLPSREDVVEQTQDDPEILSQTLAPPMSSSPVREAPQPPTSPQQTRARRRGRSGKQATYNEDSDAEETETPAKQKRNAKAKAQPGISTAQLKGLLPRRRNRVRAHDEYDMTSSGDVTQFDSDQDELQMPTRRARQRPRAGKIVSPKATKKTTHGKKASAQSKAASTASRTYSRRISSDKENNASVEDADESMERSGEISDKLAAIRKKFEEIDEFELDFETVDAVTSSSPYR